MMLDQQATKEDFTGSAKNYSLKIMLNILAANLRSKNKTSLDLS